MLRARIIPFLLIRNGRLVKTVQFGRDKYVGDPLNAVRIFNEKEVDELVVLDISASTEKREPDYKLIKSLAAECRMPLCYGGGVNRVEQIQKIVSLGVEKVALSSAAVNDPDLLTRAADRVGRQSVVAVLDVRKSRSQRRYDVFTHNGTRATGKTITELAPALVRAGAGEIVVNSIDNDGEMKGYDLALAAMVWDMIDVPMTLVGGAGSTEDVATLIERFGIVGAGAGSLFVFKGKYRAVLISYPNRKDKDRLLGRGCPDSDAVLN